MSTVVVGLDDSETSRIAFREAVRQAGWRKAKLVALHVAQYPVVSGFEPGSYIPDMMKSAEAFMERELAMLNEDLGDPAVEVVGEVRAGHPGVQLAEMAEDTGDGPAELVVLGSRGLGGFRGLMLGSVSTYAVHHVKCPLLIVPATESNR